MDAGRGIDDHGHAGGPQRPLRLGARRDPVAALGATIVPRIEHEFRIQTRWGDFDALGHLNHVSYLVYCDEARDAALAALGGSYVVAHQAIDYHREIAIGAREIVVRTRVVHVGTSSVRLEHDVADGAASSQAVVVAWDRRARTKRELTPDERDALS